MSREGVQCEYKCTRERESQRVRERDGGGKSETGRVREGGREGGRG